jgi:hypothetical protein
LGREDGGGDEGDGEQSRQREQVFHGSAFARPRRVHIVDHIGVGMATLETTLYVSESECPRCFQALASLRVSMRMFAM